MEVCLWLRNWLEKTLPGRPRRIQDKIKKWISFLSLTNCHSHYCVWKLILSIIFLYCNTHIKQFYHLTLTWVGSCSVASPVRKRKMYFKAGFEMNSFQSSLSVRIKVGFTHGACIYKISLEVNNMRRNLTYPYCHLPFPPSSTAGRCYGVYTVCTFDLYTTIWL